MKKLAIFLALVVIVNFGVLYFQSNEIPEPLLNKGKEILTVIKESANDLAEPKEAPPTPEEPIETELPTSILPPLPGLEKSDEFIRNWLIKFLTEPVVNNYFVSEKFLTRVVITVDNLSRKHAPRKYFPIKPVAGNFQVEGDSDHATIRSTNDRRYLPYIRLFEKVDIDLMIDTYVYFYPLLQEAYEKLGFPKKKFHDRVLETVSHLLDAPDVKGAIILHQPRSMYEFKDPVYESMSAGHKIMVRIGEENQSRIKRRLGSLRLKLIQKTKSLNKS
ncbi:MAG: DUF3014 domain-containing protein [Gammaproteobacteria bacterium]|nr:DUF3014 domain-containing protein [Gammaproteobacteria bacterium]MDH5692987.1 DUF3014 domain-containing protein [Gammaproteobacteria bacterium]